jgi:protein-S-isoprenylcysteine O-methyltransferase Ste14
MWRIADRGAPRPTVREWGGSAVVGMLFFVGCHGLLAHEEQFVPSGVAALCLATIPLFVPLLAWRLTEEEAFLLKNLPGYADYRRKVRWRLLPLVW